MSDTQKDLHKKLYGKLGENLVVKYLKKLGYRLIKRNFTTPYGEADIIMEKNGETFFIEVKARSSDAYGEPKDAVGYKKQEKYRKIASYYSQKHGDKQISFAVAEVVGDKVNVIFDAF